MKKRLSEEQFSRAIEGLDVGQQTKDIAYGVLVEGRPQAEYVATLQLSKGAVSQAVNRVWAASQGSVPDGYQRVTAVLPKHQAFIVKKWAAEAKRRKQEPNT